MVILPYNPTLSDADYDVLASWVKHGGKLFACYSSAPRLMRILKLKDPQYYRPGPGQSLAAIEFNTVGISGLPRRVRQASWNTTDVKPADRSVRVIGQWLDKAGKPTGHAALLLGDTGAYFGHVVLDDDPAGKQAMLLAVLGKLAPSLSFQNSL